MILWILFLVGLALFRSSYTLKTISDSYISKDNSDAVRGLFILMIMASHFSQYVPAYTEPLDTVYAAFNTHFGQCVVTMFLFYSGYGVTLSFAAKGKAYRASFLRRRLLSTLLIFDLSLLFYYFVQRAAGRKYTLTYYLLSMIGWESLGNSNWYMFVILGLYAVSLLTALLSDPKNGKQSLAMLTVGTVFFMQIMMSGGKQGYWYNTIFCYPLGALYAYVRPNVEKHMRKLKLYIPALLLSAVGYLFFQRVMRKKLAYYEMTSLLFTVSFLLLSMKIEFKSRLLKIAGRNLQYVYLIHRVPMILLGRIPFVKAHTHLYFVLSLLAIVVCTFLFRRLVEILRGVPIKKKAVADT